MKKLFFAVAFCAIGASAFSQTRSCHTMENHERLLDENPSLMQRSEDLENFIQQAISSGQVNAEKAVINIPVVVHVVYNTSSQNISDAQIQSQITVLNKDFRKLNSDVSNTPSVFSTLVADCEINFCLASVDPNGNATNGIVRKSTSVSSFSDNDAMKYSSQGGSDAWPSSSYLNLWVCKLSSGLLGYAQFPGGPATTDGVVINYTAFGSTGTAQAPFNKGRTATHEVGHWLNLRHIWGDATCGNDLVSDTPTHYTDNGGCPSHPKSNSCGTSAEMFMNYMDYTNDACMYMFTNGQKSRMQALFVNGGARASLKSSNGCGTSAGGGTTTPSYCAASSSNTSYEWISKVQLNTINNSTGASSGYADYSSISTSLNPGTTYSISLTPTYSGSTYTEYFKVYIDYNNDQDFDDAGENVYSSPGTTSTVTGSFTVPSGTAAGAKRMRVIMKDGSISGPCISYTYGEVEDYTVDIKSGTTTPSTCNAPTGLNVSGLTSSEVTLNWSSVSGANDYLVQVKLSGTSTWYDFTSSTTSLNLTGLTEGTTYNWQVTTNCSSGASSPKAGPNFTAPTSAPPAPVCSDNYESNNSRSAAKSIPVNTEVTAMIGTSTDNDYFKFTNTSSNRNIMITLTNLPYDYDLYLYNSSGSLLAKSENGGSNSETIKYNGGSLATYYVRVKGYNGAYSTSDCYKLTANISGSTFKTDASELMTFPKETELELVSIFPNPSNTGNFTCELSNNHYGDVTFTIFDAAGRIIETRTIDKSGALLRTDISVSNLQKGLYYVKVQGNEFETLGKLLYMD